MQGLDESELQFMDRIVKTGAQVPASVIQQVCRMLRDLPECASVGEKMRIASSVAPPTSREIVRKMLSFWAEKRPDVSPSHLSWALLAAGAADEALRDRESVELVWTGPSAASTSFRRTDQALLELIEAADRSLTIVTFAAYKIPSIAEAIIKAAKRNVEVALVVESHETSAGHYAHKELASWGSEIRSVAKIFTWPVEKRQRDSQGNHGSLHAKCAVADGRMAFVSSANLTEYALNINMEMGVLIKGGPIPRLIRRHFTDLVAQGILNKISG